MVMRKRGVTLQVDVNFFDKMFEPSRQKVERQLGVKVSQKAFSEMLFKSNINLNVKLNKKGIINVNKNKKSKKK